MCVWQGGGPQLADSCFLGCAREAVWQRKRGAGPTDILHLLKFVSPCDGSVGGGEACYVKTCRERPIFKPLAFFT